jgi:hypothetical protein
MLWEGVRGFEKFLQEFYFGSKHHASLIEKQATDDTD